MANRKRTGAKSPYALAIIMLLAISFFIPQQDAFAAWDPRGIADLTITLSNPSFAPIEITEENFDLLLDDVSSLPLLLNQTMMPKVREVFISNNETLHNEYIESISVLYDVDKKEMQINVNAKPHAFPSQTFNITASANTSASVPEMSVIRQVSVLMPVFWNYTYEDVGMHVAIMNRLEVFSIERTEILADHAKGTLLMNKYELLSPDERYERRTTGNTTAPTALTTIRLEMLSFELARATAVYAPEENSWWRKAFDEIKDTDYLLTGRFRE